MDPSSQRKRQSQAVNPDSNTAIESLSDDVLTDIIVRLPTPTALGRAALACRRWRRLATSPDFLRRHRAFHPSPPQLIGCFFSAIDGLPLFRRVADSPNHDLDALLRSGDFSLTSFDYRWKLQDCRDGLLLMSNYISIDRFALSLFDPISRHCVSIPIPDHGEGGVYGPVLCLLPSCRGDNVGDASFRVVSLNFFCEKNEPGNESVRAHTYSSGTGGWRSHPCSPLLLRCHDLASLIISQAMHATGRIYWKNRYPGLRSGSELLISLNTNTMEFSDVAPPPVPGLSNDIGSYVVGDTEDGACCLVIAPIPEHDTLQVWLRNEDEESWELCWELQASELPYCIHGVAAVMAGVLIVPIDADHGDSKGDSYVAMCIKTAPVDGERITCVFELLKEKEEAILFGPVLKAYPYFMTWPRPALLQ